MSNSDIMFHIIKVDLFMALHCNKSALIICRIPEPCTEINIQSYRILLNLEEVGGDNAFTHGSTKEVISTSLLQTNNISQLQ